jgi:hypothetical protein
VRCADRAPAHDPARAAQPAEHVVADDRELLALAADLACATPGVAATLLYASPGIRDDSLNGPPRPRSTIQRSVAVFSISQTPSAMLPW